MSCPDGDVLVLGIGNVLMRDEGVGVHVVRALMAAKPASEGWLPARTRVVDGGTLGLELLPLLDDARAAIIVDSVDLGLIPGTTVVLRGDAVEPALGRAVSAHQLGIVELVEAARLTGSLPESVSIVGVQPELIEVGLDLTPVMLAALPRAVELVRQEAWDRSAG